MGQELVAEQLVVLVVAMVVQRQGVVVAGQAVQEQELDPFPFPFPFPFLEARSEA